MIRTTTLLITGLFLFFPFLMKAQWQPAGNFLKTEWADKVDAELPLPEYPRPILERKAWQNLNGLWDYQIVERKSLLKKDEGEILVPFPLESSLSGVMKPLDKDQKLIYSRSFTIPQEWKEKEILLHFGAVDWQADVYLNGIKIGAHEGGYTPFSFNITSFLNEGTQELKVIVWDPGSEGPQPRGKQVTNPEGIWYTSVSGIWQTVWIEPVHRVHIRKLNIQPDIGQSYLRITPEIQTVSSGIILKAEVYDKDVLVTSASAALGQSLDLFLENPKLWSPESPFLYSVKLTVLLDGQVVDTVESYAAMRKISMKRDDNGIIRMQLNDRDYFSMGTLDQGWWPDGLYTAPSDEALKYDIIKTKEYGFNTIRKHVKVEPARWYMHCDQLGMLVWQDMPSGAWTGNWQRTQYFVGSETTRDPRSEAIFRNEWKAIMDFLQPYPSIVVWVPFNEAWGQFKTVEITEWTKAMDPFRLVNSASGGNHFQTGDILDLHKYPQPDLFLYDANRITVLGEYGGIGLPLKGHLWKPNDNWGYIKFANSREVTDEYVKYAEQLAKLAKTGFSAAIYTQTTDVEGEVNGLLTYDRKVMKLEPERVRKANERIIQAIQE